MALEKMTDCVLLLFPPVVWAAPERVPGLGQYKPYTTGLGGFADVNDEELAERVETKNLDERDEVCGIWGGSTAPIWQATGMWEYVPEDEQEAILFWNPESSRVNGDGPQRMV
jgi:hypothetical protein